MAEGGSCRQSVIGSDTFYDYNCSECFNRNGTYTEAVFYCPECNKYFCKPCYVCDHDVIGRRNMDKWGQSSKKAQFDPCKKHKGQLLQLYCRKHDVVCCPLCSKNDHKSCGDSLFIPLVANDKDNKAGLMKVKKDLAELQLDTDKANNDKVTMLTDLNQTELTLVTDVKCFRVRADAMLDNMEKTSLDEISKNKSVLENRYKSGVDMYCTIKTEIADLKNKLDLASADESLLFSRIKQGNEQVRHKRAILSDITSSDSSDTFNAEFKPHIEIENLPKVLQGLGKVITKKPYKTVHKTSIKVKTKQDKETCSILGMCMVPSGHLILADNMNDSLKKVSSQYKVTARCSLTAGPWDVCHTEADQVAVALGYTVQLVTVSGSMSCTSSFSTDHHCASLAYSNKCLYIIEEGRTVVYVYNLVGTRLRVIYQDQHGKQLLFSYTRRITTSRGGERLHITDREDLVTMDTRGNLISRFTSDKLKDSPYAVSADGEGNVFVGGKGSKNVLQVGGEADKKLAELLSDSDGIQVESLCFDGVRSRLLVSSYDSDTVNVLHLSK